MRIGSRGVSRAPDTIGSSTIEFRQFLDAVDAAAPRHLDGHLTMDNCGH
jgi:hypothetical protein